MTFAILLPLLSAPDGSEQVTIARLTAQECPPPSSDDGELVGDRAIIADDGSRIVVQCGNGVVSFWQSGATSFTSLGIMPLFRAAREHSIVPIDLRCPGPSAARDLMETEVDCDVVDHDSTNRIFVLRDPAGTDSYLVAGPKILRESTVWQRFGALSAGRDRPYQLYLVDGEKNTETLQGMTVDGRLTTIDTFPRPNLVLEDGEGEANDVIYSSMFKTIIISFGGASQVAEEMTYLRAFDDNGKERWNIKIKLPARGAGQSIVSDFTKIMGFFYGQYALFAKTRDRNKAHVIDLEDGKITTTINGWPIAAARNSSIILTRDREGSLSLKRLDLPNLDIVAAAPAGR